MNMSRIWGLFQDLIGFLIYYSRVNVGANRVNLAIVSRPIIGICNGSDAFFNIYALANKGTDVEQLSQPINTHFVNIPQVNWMIAGDFNRDPSTITNTVDRELANKIRVVFPTSATQANGGTLDYAITGN
ncbi:hypothetical protein C3H85_07705 [Campylobacter jejuni]|uniref:hypothetical protein n=1 Tax=Campylobacter jejuni TaxID=197 RepID=UPI000F80FF83|nr:hypothetical protein C3H85_07705 [Campylobacter jejuni]